MTTQAILALAAWLGGTTAHHYAHHIDASAMRYRVDPLLVVALIYRESSFRSGASEGRNYGLMQVRVSQTTWDRWSVARRRLFNSMASY